MWINEGTKIVLLLQELVQKTKYYKHTLLDTNMQNHLVYNDYID